jgi:hypothetical protein
MAGQSPRAEIHEQEGEIIENVDGGDGVVELDGVEQHRDALDLDDVAKVQVPMAVAHIACLRSRLQQKSKYCKRFAARMIDASKRSSWKDGFLAGKDRGIVLNHRKQRRHAFLCSEKAICVPVEFGNDACKLRHGSQRQAPVLRHAVEELRLVESAHDQPPLDNFALTGNLEFAAHIESYRKNLKIKLRCYAAIEVKLIEKRAAPQP